jgi:hypothetical protein
MRELKFRAWDKENGCFETSEIILIELDGDIYNRWI